MRATINSEKHVIPQTVDSVASGVRTNINIVNADNALSNAFDVRVGAVVKAIYIEMWIDGVTASKTVIAQLTKIPAGQSGPTFAQMTSPSTYPNKNNVLEFHQGLAPTGGNLIPLFRGWVRIPKGKQRMAIGDQWNLSIAAVATTINFCGVFIYKEYY